MAEKDVLSFAAATQLVMLLVLSWSTASHLAWSGPKEGALSAAGLPSRVVKGEELQDMMPMEPLWDILLPLISLAVGTSLGALGMQITLGMTFVQPLLLLLLPSFLTILESFHERLLAWHLGGIFGQPMLVAQVAIAHAERHEGAGCLKAFGVLVGIYTLGAVLGGLIRSLLQMLPWPYAHQACAQLLILFLVVGNLMTIWHNGHMLGHHEEHTPLLSERKNLKVFKERCSKYLVSEVQRGLRSFSSCSRHLAARAALLLGLTCIMGPAPLPALDLLTFTLHPSRAANGALAVFWFDLVGSISYAFLVPMLDILGDPARRLRGLDLFYYPCFGSLMLALFAANFHFTTAMKVSVTAGLLLSSCCAVVSAVLTADMSEKAPHLADVGVRLAQKQVEQGRLSCEAKDEKMHQLIYERNAMQAERDEARHELESLRTQHGVAHRSASQTSLPSAPQSMVVSPGLQPSSSAKCIKPDAALPPVPNSWQPPQSARDGKCISPVSPVSGGPEEAEDGDMFPGPDFSGSYRAFGPMATVPQVPAVPPNPGRGAEKLVDILVTVPRANGPEDLDMSNYEHFKDHRFHEPSRSLQSLQKNMQPPPPHTVQRLPSAPVHSQAYPGQVAFPHVMHPQFRIVTSASASVPSAPASLAAPAGGVRLAPRPSLSGHGCWICGEVTQMRKRLPAE